MVGGEESGKPVVLGDGVRDGWLLRAYCDGCGHNTALRPAVLAASLGYDFPVGGLARRLRCSQCRGRNVEVRVQMPDPGVVARHGPQAPVLGDSESRRSGVHSRVRGGRSAAEPTEADNDRPERH